MEKRENIYNYMYIIIGCLLAAFGTACFLLPNKLSSGGFAGIATIIYYFYKIPMGTTILVINIPFFILGYFKLGKAFVLKTIIATFFYSELINLFSENIRFVHDNFISSIYGGIFIGIGLGFVFKGDASTGGTDLIAHITQKYNSKMKVSNILVFVDIIIVGVNLIAFKDIEIGLYSMIVIYLSGKMIDFVFEGINFCKIIYIISNDSVRILNKINDEDFGATGLFGKGAYTEKNTTIIMCVTKRREVMKVKNLAQNIDKNAFIVIADAREVYGLGFKN